MARRAQLRIEAWFNAIGVGAIGGLLIWSLFDLLRLWFGAPHSELSILVLIGISSTVLGRAVRDFALRDP